MGSRTSSLKSAKKSYRRRVSRSMCKKMATKKKCIRMRGCSWYKKSAKGKGYCRKQHNKKRYSKRHTKTHTKRHNKRHTKRHMKGSKKNTKKMLGGSKQQWQFASGPANY